MWAGGGYNASVMAEPKRRYTLPRSVRLRSRREFDYVFTHGVRLSDAYLTAFVARREGGPARLGIGVGRRFGRAVRRNRIKRLIREAFRHVRHELPPGSDWVIIPRPGVEPSVRQIQDSIRRLAGRL